MVSSGHLFGHVFILICILHVLPWLTWCVLLGKVTTNSDRKQNLESKVQGAAWKGICHGDHLPCLASRSLRHMSLGTGGKVG